MKTVLSPIKYILKSVYVQLILLPLSYLHYVLNLRHKNSFHIIVCNHIGDFIFTMGYVKAYKEQNHLSQITIIAAQKFEPIFERYQLENISFCACSTGWLNRFEEVDRYVSGRLMYRSLADVLMIAPGNNFIMGYHSILPIVNITGLTLRDLLAYGNMRLLPDACYETISAPRIRGKKEKKILICPDAQMLQWKEKEQFFKMLQEAAQQMGYETVVNISHNKIGLEVFFDHCIEYTAVIGMRSGLLDLAANAGSFTIALYPPEYATYMHFYNIQKMNPQTSCAQYLLTDQISYDVKQILNMCEV